MINAPNLKWIVFCLVPCLGVFLYAPPVFAQTASSTILIVGQGINNEATSTFYPNGYESSYSYTAYIGSGYSGTSTGAVLAVTGTNLKDDTLRVDIIDLTDNTRICTWDLPSTAVGPANENFYDLNNLFQQTNNGCTFQPGDDYTVGIDFVQYYSFGGDPRVSTYFGSSYNVKTWAWTQGPSNVTATFFPYFAITTNAFTISSVNYNSISTSTCTVINPTGCFQNALLWAFYPPPGSFDQIAALQGLLNAKPPFGYFTQAQNDISNFGAATSSIFSLGTITGITDYIFGPIDAGLAAIWWAVVGIWFFFHRLRHIDI